MRVVDEWTAQAKRSPMIEYCVIGDVNDSDECAHQLGQLLSSRKSMVPGQ
jgi:adenine C2-methylase RlmN of 23S rRNA A2503 and tRNA A37